MALDSLVIQHAKADLGKGIYTARVTDGGDLVRLSPFRGQYASYSPDGTQVALTPSHTRAYMISGRASGLWVVNADGTGLHLVAHNYAIRPGAGLLTDGGSCPSPAGRRSTSFAPTAPGFSGSRWSRRGCVPRSIRRGLLTAPASCLSEPAPVRRTFSRLDEMARISSRSPTPAASPT